MNQWSEVIHRKSEKPIVYSISLYIYIYRQIPGLCPETQPRQATHHHHHQQTLFEIIQNQDRSLTRMGELNPY